MRVRAIAATTTALLAAAALVTLALGARAGGVGGQVTVVAHRGASAYAPENTLPAVDEAARRGFTWVENDVQRTKDGELVVLHDDSLTRTTNAEEVFPGRAPWKVKDFTAAEIARLDAGSWFKPAYAGTRVPTLKEYMRRVEHDHEKLLLEIKSPELYPGIERETVKLLGNEGWLDPWHAGRLVVQSFSAGSLRIVHDLRPGLTTGYLGAPPVAELPAYAGFTDLINPAYGSVSSDYVAAVHACDGPHGRPLGVFTWTVNDAPTARKAASYGVDGIITNEPDLVREALSAL
ncbi:glycerophosphodiester phosphodiesterase [Streptomyces sp. NPDC056161]|uniref:glycerophosphodiester phosphodiesterase n=1 Tax=Streptomyces sp. NPDC056161 TaxID=3345732 RepID=UPI0035D58D3D